MTLGQLAEYFRDQADVWADIDADKATLWAALAGDVDDYLGTGHDDVLLPGMIG